jgi:hypothetical protein
MIRSLFKIDTLILFGFIFGKATYIGVIESSYQLFIINFVDYKWNGVEWTNYNFDYPYLLLMVYSATLFVMHVIPRFPLRFNSNTKSCFWPHFVILMMITATACTLLPIVFGENYCWEWGSICTTESFPLILMTIFIAIL